ncbi:uncharacterized protein L969DRAFT_90271 [Mixia osmundae IAM 14324]|uniref:DUF7729 domain-containing protein n=1 Tax=Mixia osmundae (strain CBS 9802 / IAM 14324 / JCM 22182 / KY 12970) TaxID=764103 RepID=G7DZM8_MIXOS|nr:uncharacterized protein L969DRAFT_90271 [Mixia osmundae IAM 14324]KEI37200.1 hypothetical protein L969DRAFT_90271 [Mixia osmundae IAM 14324]GAA96038.1 hypothetical protein E5Q_02698 [Mixia osmundae IAM 14324]
MTAPSNSKRSTLPQRQRRRMICSQSVCICLCLLSILVAPVEAGLQKVPRVHARRHAASSASKSVKIASTARRRVLVPASTTDTPSPAATAVYGTRVSTEVGANDAASSSLDTSALVASVVSSVVASAVSHVTATSSAYGASRGGSSTASRTRTGPQATGTQVVPLATMPQPFDTVLSTNFSSTACPSFFEQFLASPSFRSCYPFSLLLGTSTAFFQIQSNLTALSAVLDNSCAADTQVCSDKMISLAQAIQDPAACGNDLKAGNALAQSALNGFLNYDMMSQVGCLKDNSTGDYCFAEAASNDTSVTDLYWYQLPLGTTLPSGTQASCDACLVKTMSIYSDYASNSTLPISRTYNQARSVGSINCGPSWSPLVVATAANSAASLFIPVAFVLVSLLFTLS